MSHRQMELGQLILSIEDNLQKIAEYQRNQRQPPKELIEQTRIYALEYHQRTGKYYIH